MEETKGQRLKKYLSSINMTNVELADKLGLGTGAAVGNWTNNRQEIPADKIIMILILFRELNADWFINNRGQMIANQMDTSNEPQPPYHTECKNPLCKLRIESLEREIELLEANISDLRRKENCGQGELKGGVEKRGKAG